MPKTRINLSQNAISVVNELLTNGNRVQIDFDPRTNQLTIYRVPRMETKYRVVVAAG